MGLFHSCSAEDQTFKKHGTISISYSQWLMSNFMYIKKKKLQVWLKNISHLQFPFIILILRLIGVSSYVQSTLVQVKTSSTFGINTCRIHFYIEWRKLLTWSIKKAAFNNAYLVNIHVFTWSGELSPYFWDRPRLLPMKISIKMLFCTHAHNINRYVYVHVRK